MMRLMINRKEAWPIFLVVGGALALATYKVYHDAVGYVFVWLIDFTCDY
jgi:hypothetical protein